MASCHLLLIHLIEKSYMSKLSRYNHFQPWEDGSHLAYNAVSGAVAVLNQATYNTYLELSKKLSANGCTELIAEEQQLLQQLRYGKFAYPDGFSELDGLKFDHFRIRFDQSALLVVIAPTLACNMACEYCYEANKHGRMSHAVVRDVIAYIRKRSQGIERMEVQWYGGEPLLALDIIEEISHGILGQETNSTFKYESMVITNGYLLDSTTVDRLIDLKISAVQVTLDGPLRIHDSKRPLKNGRSSYQTILENIKYASSRMSVGVRVNIDKHFKPEWISELVSELQAAGVHNKIWMHFGQIEASESSCSNISEACYSSKDYSRAETEYYKLLLNEGFHIQKLPSPVGAFCMAQQTSGVLIDPDGDFYSCFKVVGDKSRTIGNVASDINYQSPEFQRLFRFDPFETEECRECSILPICMGGCPARRCNQSIDSESLCDSWKYNLEPMLEIIALARQRQMEQAVPMNQEKS